MEDTQTKSEADRAFVLAEVRKFTVQDGFTRSFHDAETGAIADAIISRLSPENARVTDAQVKRATKAHFAERRAWRGHGQTWEEGCENPDWEKSKYEAMRVAIETLKPENARVGVTDADRERVRDAIRKLSVYQLHSLCGENFSDELDAIILAVMGG